jgi:ketosteroid isomerase-like protein
VVSAVRQTLSGGDRSQRSLDERFAIRFPRLAALQARAVAALPVSSRLRKNVVARTAGLALAAYNRRDVDAVAALCDPDFEYRPGRQWVDAGLTDATYHGRDGYRRYLESVDQVWAGENRLTPREVVDLGDRLLLLADGDMRAQASGLPLSQEFALLCTLKAGRTIVAQEYYDHAEALEAVGLS